LLAVQTHEQLARSVLARLGRMSDREQGLSRAGEWMAMREALRRAAPLPRLGPLVGEPSCTSDAIALVSACKRALVGPGLLAARLQGAPESLAEIAVLADSYERVLVDLSARDPRDWHRLALEALLADPAVLRGWADLLLVDEAEDLSPAQWLLIRELGERLSHPRRLVLAGHWSESTPGFRGVACEASSRPFEEYFPAELGARDWPLPSVLPGWTGEAAAGLGLDLTDGAEPAPLAALPEAAFRVQPQARVWAASDETDEALAVAREIMRARLQGEVEYRQVAILVHSPGRQLTPLVAALQRLGVPHRVDGSGLRSGHPLVAAVLNWLRVLSAPSDDAVLLAALASGPAGISREALRVLRRWAGWRDLPASQAFWEWARQDRPGASPAGADEAEAEQWRQLRSAGQAWLRLEPWADRWGREELSRAQLQSALGEVELASGAAARALTDLNGAGALAELARTADTVAGIQLRFGPSALTLPAWLEQLELLLRQAGPEPGPDPEPPADAVELLGFRQAKGRSWPRVFICGCVTGAVPAAPETGGLLDGDELQELVRRIPELEDVLSFGERQQDAEGRLFLMALTRATEQVTCSWPRRDQGRAAERSPFVAALIAAGPAQVGVPAPEPVAADDVALELALSPSAAPRLGLTPALVRAANELRQALAPWDPVADGPALIPRPITLSATAVGAWLACPRQYLAQRLVVSRDQSADLTLGTQAHLLLELLYRRRSEWEGQSGAFTAFAGEIINREILPTVRAQQPDPLQVMYVQIWLEQLVRRWDRRIVAPGTAQVGAPIAEEVTFDLPRGDRRLRGQVDALWRHPNGEVEVLDYKTSREASSDGALRTEVFGRAREGPTQWQLPIYQLAAKSGAFVEHLGAELPALVRNWYVGADPGPRDPDPIPASGFRIVAGAETGEAGSLTEAELDRLDAEIDRMAQAILMGRFPAQPRHAQRTCRDGRSGCPVSFWCDGEDSVGAEFPTSGPRL